MRKESAGTPFSAHYLLIILSCCGMVAASIGLFTNAYGILLSPMAEGLHVSRGDISMHVTLRGLAMGFAGVVVIRYAQSHPVRPIITGGVAAAFIGTLLSSRAGSLWQLNLLAVLQGIGLSCFNYGIVTMMAGNWFEKNTGTVFGLIASFSGLSGAVFNPIFSRLITVLGYRRALMIMGFATILLTLPAILFAEMNPLQKGLMPYGHEEKEPASSGANGSEAAGSWTDAASESFVPLRYFSAAFLILCLIGFFSNFSTGFASHIPGVAEAAGKSAAFGALLMSVIMIANISFKFVIGFIADRIGPVPSSQLMLGTELVGVILMLILTGGVSSGPDLMAAGFLYGSMYSFGAVGISLVTRYVYGIRQYGGAYSVLSMIGNISNALAIAFIGYAYDFTGSYRPVLLILCLFIGFSIVLLGVLKRQRGKIAAA